MKLEKGIYENLIDSKLAADIKVSEENGLICSKDAMDSAPELFHLPDSV